MRLVSQELEPINAAALSNRQARLQARLLGNPKRTYEELKDVLDQARRLRNETQETLALMNLAGCSFLLGDYPDMLSLSYQALDLSRATRTHNHEARALNSIGLAQQRLGELDTAMRYFMDSLRLSQERLEDLGVARALGNIALLHVTLHEYDIALRLHEQALELAQRASHVVGTADMMGGVLEDHYHLGNYEKALELAPESILHSLHHDLARYECDSRATQARTLLALGRATTCVRVAQSAYNVASWSHDVETQGLLRFIEGQALLELGDLKTAEQYLLESINIAEKLGHKDHARREHATLARLYKQLGDLTAHCFHHERSQELKNQLFASDVTDRATEIAKPITGTADDFRAHTWSLELFELTKTLKRARVQLATHEAIDALTGCMTKAQFIKHTQQHLDVLAPGELAGIIVVHALIDDNEKTALNQNTITSLWRELARRLQNQIRIGDHIGRLEADTFSLHLSHLAQETDLDMMAARCAEATNDSYLIRGQRITLHCTITHALAPRDGVSVDALIEGCHTSA